MIVSNGRRFVFVHIPKTGGTSMALALEARAMKDDILIGDTPKAQRRKGRLSALTPRGRLWKHSTLADIDGILSPEALRGYFVFTLVRNPWDRLVSYYHWLRVQSFDHDAVRIAQSHTFEGFLLHPHTTASLRRASYGSYMRDASGSEHADLWIRLENLQADMEPLVQHLGFVPDMAHVNRSDRPADYRTAYSTRARDAVAEICAEDIARFSYQFGA